MGGTIKIHLYICVCISLLLITISTHSQELTLKQILDKFDMLYRSTASYAELEMIIKNPNWKRSITLKAWSRGMDETFIKIITPKKDSGISTLRIKNEMWNYFPKIDKIIKVPPSMRMGSWMGSDFTNDDLVKETSLQQDYFSKFINKSNNNFFIELKPKKNTISVWGKIILEIRKKDHLPIKMEYFDEKGEKTRIMHFEEMDKLGNRTLPKTLRIVPLKKKGHQTIVRYRKAQFDIDINPSIFSKRNLKRKSRY